VEDIHHIHNCGGDVKWNRNFREANQVVNGLSKHDLTLDYDIKFFEFLSFLFVMLC
jgi:hypothetical protein